MELQCGGLLANSTPSSSLRLVLNGSYLELHSDFVGHYCKEIECCFLFYRLFLKVGSTLVVIKTIVLEYSESTKHTVGDKG